MTTVTFATLSEAQAAVTTAREFYNEDLVIETIAPDQHIVSRPPLAKVEEIGQGVSVIYETPATTQETPAATPDVVVIKKAGYYRPTEKQKKTRKLLAVKSATRSHLTKAPMGWRNTTQSTPSAKRLTRTKRVRLSNSINPS